MAFEDYTDLMISVSEYTNRDDVAHLFDRFVKLAETKLNRRLRVADMDTEVQLTTDANGDATLPSDFLEFREVKDSVGRIMKSNSIVGLTRAYGNRGGTPRGYAIVGNEMQVHPIGAATFDCVYYQKIPSLTANSTNWLLTRAPDVYLYATGLEVAVWSKNAELVAASNLALEDSMSRLTIDDERGRFGNAALRLSGVTP